MGTGAVKRSSLETISTRRKKWCPVWNGGTKHTAHDWEIFTQQTEAGARHHPEAKKSSSQRTGRNQRKST